MYRCSLLTPKHAPPFPPLSIGTQVLRRARIVGMTTTGLAAKQAQLEALGPKVKMGNQWLVENRDRDAVQCDGCFQAAPN
jgi:hypothetical protein